jgi:FAD/FMN-containing dehydrogenase/Fe-S oxidoreductase
MTTLRDVDVDASLRRRMEYAHDASNYRIAPLAVAFPRTREEVSRIVTACAEQGVPVTARGGGTSMAGNAVGHGVVIDLSRHLTAVSIDPAAKTATVQAGVVLDALRRAAAAHGLTFGPDPSSHSRCTIGGMIGNDACGNHSVAFGRTVDHVRELSVVLADGTAATVQRTKIAASNDAIEQTLREIGVKYADEIRRGLNRFGRQVSGYPLNHLLPESLDFAKSLVGTEGTCAVVTGTTLNLVPAATAPILVVAGYDDVRTAAADVPAVLEHGPTAIEGMDEAVVRMLHGDGPAQALRRLPAGRAWLLIEVDRATKAESLNAATKIKTAARKAAEVRVVEDPKDQRRLWTIREDGAGLAARSPDGRKFWPGWEDAAVPPDALAGYLADFLDLRRRHGLDGAIYGHFGAGCIHTRIDFERTTEAGRAVMDRFLHDAAALVVRHGGSLSGEHGDGRARGALLPLMYSPALLEAFAECKAAWDPRNTLNPQILVRAEPVTAHLDIRPVTNNEGRCVGIAKCRSAVSGVMCPSYRATGDERDSTRGRARVLQELLDGQEPGAPEAILDALDLCLSCKACSTDCPTGVDMATYKSQFLHKHYRRRIRPVSHLSLGWSPIWFRLAARWPTAANVVLRRRIGLRLAGVTAERSMPVFARAKSWPAPEQPKSVVLVDTFTGAFRPQVITALRNVLDDADLAPAAAPRTACCALPWISTGQLGIARRVLRRTARLLDGSDLPIVVPEPSCAAALREDLPHLLPGESSERLAARVHTLAGALAEHAPQWTPATEPSTVVQQVHCHEYATWGADQQLARFGITAERAEGCCGLAGNFGFERQHYDVSMKVAEHGLGPMLDHQPDAPLLADGFSCMLQASHIRNRQALHLAELLQGVNRVARRTLPG